jgi:RNA polymerase primary sigma factor
LIGKVKKTTDVYVEEFGHMPTVEYLSEKLGETTDMVRAAIEHMNPNSTIALDHSPGGGEETEKTLHNYLKDDNASSPLDAISHKELVSGIRNVIKTLSPRDEKILRLRFGITEDPKDHDSWTITEGEMELLKKRAKDGQ